MSTTRLWLLVTSENYCAICSLFLQHRSEARRR